MEIADVTLSNLQFNCHLDLMLGLIDLGDLLKEITKIMIQYLQFHFYLNLGLSVTD